MAIEPPDGAAGLDESLRRAVNDWVVAELGRQRRELHALRVRLRESEAGQGGVRDATPAGLEQRLNEVNRRLDFLASELAQRLDDQARRLDGLVADLNRRLDHLNGRLDEAYGHLRNQGEGVVRRDEYVQLLARHDRLERALESLRERLSDHGVNPGR